MSPKTATPMSFSCQNCGHSYQVHPPDSHFKYAYIKLCSDNDGDPDHNFKQGYECDNCNYRNVLYWCPGHHFIVSSRDVQANRTGRGEGMEGLSRGRFGRDSLFD